MRTEGEIRALLKKCAEVEPGNELEVDGNYYNFWEGLGEFMAALEWVLNEEE